MTISFVGHVSRDINVVKGVPLEVAGGGGFFGAIAASRLGAGAVLVTKCAREDRAGFSDLQAAGVRVEFVDSPRSTSIRNEYPTDNPDDRMTRLLSRAEPFAEADLAPISGEVVHVNPLWCGEFPPELIPAVRSRARILAGDAQGFLRHVLPDGMTAYRNWAEKRRWLPFFDVFKVDLKEAGILTGETEPRAAARAVRALGAGTVLLTHRDGVCAFDGASLCEASFGPYSLEGRTGRGDTCTAAFLVEIPRAGIASATRFAASVTTEKMQYPGPYRGRP